MELVPTGVAGLDEVLGGGLREQSTVLVSGRPGTGKSILGMEYLYRGAVEHGDDGIYLSFEESADDLSASAASLGFERWDELVEGGDVTVVDKRDLLRRGSFTDTFEFIVETLEDGDHDRLVMDSVTMFQIFFDNEQERRVSFIKFSDVLKSVGVTSLLVAEQSEPFRTADVGIEHFLTDGNIVVIQTQTSSGVNRFLWVSKMRRQAIDSDIFPMEIGTGGITVHRNAAGFSMMDAGGM
jgi:KaiC/GvpD/RAD55 family RecA-like ATPase